MQRFLSDTAGRVRVTEKSITLDGNNETKSQDLFSVTGSVLVYKIWAEVTTVIGANHTAGHLRVDAAAATVITAAAGATLSGLAAGTLMIRENLVSQALEVLNNATQVFNDPIAVTPAFTQFIVGKKTGVPTHIEYRYTTTDTPTSGVLKWKAQWEPLSDDGALAAA